MQTLKTEQYKGYPIRFTEKIMGNRKLVVGDFPSKITGRVLGVQGANKEIAFKKCKTMIDREYKTKV